MPTRDLRFGRFALMPGEPRLQRVGAEDEPQCMLVCPADCIVPNPDFQESQDELMAKYEYLH